MPGMQSNTNPDPNGPKAAPIGPLEAVKSYRNRQRATEATLAAMDEEESDGRPAWLRRWPSEVRREIAAKRYEAERGSELAAGDESLPLSENASRPEMATEPPNYAGSSNGYSGQSIEAAFSFETVYRFETEFEAEATKDWLNLSEDGAKVSRHTAAAEIREASLAAPSTEENAKDADGGTGRATGVAFDGELKSATDELTESAARVDPQAVRAAIFRLAQESSAGFHPGITLEGTPFVEETSRDATEPELEVATDIAELRGVTHEVLPEAENASSFLLANARESSKEQVLPSIYGAVPRDAGTLSTTEGTRDLFVHGDAAVTPMPPDEGARATEVFAAASANQPEIPVIVGVGGDVQSSLREGGGTAGQAPALAHDAGNLLSALNLYSELLALSGVLHARHKHYAQDLKLLAARSEVLISRLLAICKVAGSIQEDAAKTSASTEIATFAEDATQQDPGTGEELKGDTRAATSPLRVQAGEAVWDASPAQQTRILAAGLARPPAEPIKASEVAEQDERLGEISSLAGISELAAEDDAPLNLVDLLTHWQSLLSMIGRGTVEVSFGPNAELPIRIKEEMMERILVNLVHNSMTATRNGGAIRIGVGRVERRRSVESESMPSSDGRAQPGSRMVLTVDDSGCGMTEEQVARIFDRPLASAGVDSGDASRGARRGLGLQIVRELVAASGGRLAIYSRSGSGTRAEMDWPTAEESVGLTRIPPVSAAAGGQALMSRFRSGQSLEQGREIGIYPAHSLRQAAGPVTVGVEGAIAC